eukprot:TRINITY_DN15976_c0_g1_i1.p1 TRINITY_DN15976_c0_g1~~TRINITY_DN15976_c0_g1_i1.p1  ORF type:complete len:342 (+),score=72.43 TRINITY_DN15976_c0_g1_i1:61-1026(+)
MVEAPAMYQNGSTFEDEDDEEDDEEDEEDEGTADKPSKPRPPKSAEKVERDERLAANFALHEKLTNEELQKQLPKTVDGSVTSIGAMLHAGSQCAVCIFHHSPKGCYNGIRCKFCHHDHEKPQRRRRGKKEGGEGGEATADGQRSEGGRARPRKRRRRSNVNAADGVSDLAVKEPTDSNAELGSAEIPVLDEVGNSRPSWLLDDLYYGAHFYRPQAANFPQRHAAAHPYWQYPPPIAQGYTQPAPASAHSTFSQQQPPSSHVAAPPQQGCYPYASYGGQTPASSADGASFPPTQPHYGGANAASPPVAALPTQGQSPWRPQ